MKIKHYLYNAFLIETKTKKIAIDPGGLFLYFFRLTTLIPESEWKDITHIFVTHGDPDHYWHLERVAAASGAKVVCNRSMLSDESGDLLMLGPRSKGLTFTAAVANVHSLAVDQTLEVDGMKVTGIKTTHGRLQFKLGPFSKAVVPGPQERVGWGAIGFQIQVDGKRIVNLGDTMLLAEEWASLSKPDILMIPIGGKSSHNTMDEDEALEAVKAMEPEIVIPCHYNLPAFFTKHFCPADDQYFKAEAERLGSRCIILGSGDSTEI